MKRVLVEQSSGTESRGGRGRGPRRSHPLRTARILDWRVAHRSAPARPAVRDLYGSARHPSTTHSVRVVPVSRSGVEEVLLAGAHQRGIQRREHANGPSVCSGLLGLAPYIW